MDFNFAFRHSSLTPDEAAEVLARTFAATKVATSLGDPTQVVNGRVVPHMPMEALRNALIGSGLGAGAGLISELGKDEKERDYRRLLDKTLMGGLLGGGGTLAYRSLLNSGSHEDPAVLQDLFNDVTNPQPEPDHVQATIDANRPKQAPAAPGQPAPTLAKPDVWSDTVDGAAIKLAPHSPDTAQTLHDLNRMSGSHIAAVGGGGVAGGLAGLGLASRANTGLHWLTRTKPPAPGPLGWKGKLFRTLATGAGAYAGANAGNWGHKALTALPGVE